MAGKIGNQNKNMRPGKFAKHDKRSPSILPAHVIVHGGKNTLQLQHPPPRQSLEHLNLGQPVPAEFSRINSILHSQILATFLASKPHTPIRNDYTIVFFISKKLIGTMIISTQVVL